MISRYNQHILSSTVVSPLLLSIAIVVIALFPSDYWNCWVDLFIHFKMPGFVWIMVNVFLVVFIYTFFATRSILNNAKRDKSTKSIKLQSLQPKTTNVLQIIAMLAPWTTLIFKGADTPVVAILIIIAVVALTMCIAMSRHGYSSLVFVFLGYNCYEGKNVNGTPITLLSKRHWNNAADISKIVPLTDEMALIV